MKLTLLSVISILFAASSFAEMCKKDQLVTLRFHHVNGSMQTIPAGSKAQLLGFKNGYADVHLFIAAPKAGMTPTQCELVQKTNVLVGANSVSFLECELGPI